jgi:hypothetical protein
MATAAQTGAEAPPLVQSITLDENRDWLMDFVRSAPEARLHDVAAIAASPASEAFLRARVEAAVRNGHTIAADAERTPYEMSRRGHELLLAVVDLVMGHAPTPESLARALRKVDQCGGLLLSLRDRIFTELALRSSEGDADRG